MQNKLEGDRAEIYNLFLNYVSFLGMYTIAFFDKLLSQTKSLTELEKIEEIRHL